MHGRRIAARQPPPIGLPELRRTLLDEWCNILQDQIDNLILSMRRRCNDKICSLSNQRRSTLRFDLVDFEGDDGSATYDNFFIDDEAQGYRLHLGDYRGVIGELTLEHSFSTSIILAQIYRVIRANRK
ncbi:techylectin-5A [Trichonephila clavipes]|nr:techylectin-5A [Trichonephila clavipes]